MTPRSLSLTYALTHAHTHARIPFPPPQVVPSECGTTAHPLFCCGFRRGVRTDARTQVVALRGSGGANAATARTPLYLRLMPCLRRRGTRVTRGGGRAGDVSTPAPTKDGTVSAPASLTLNPIGAAPLLEAVPEDVASRGGVHLHGLTKAFLRGRTPRLAVDDVSMSFYEGQVTCLLGHNGESSGALWWALRVGTVAAAPAATAKAASTK